MNGNSLFVDTNILLYLFSGDRTVAEILNGKEIFISFITELELLSFDKLTFDEEKKIKEFLAQCHIVDVNRNIKQKTIIFRKNNKIKLPDAIIAASSSFIGIPLFTADRDFAKVDGLNVLIYEL